MPRATVSSETVRRELKSCPPDGYVVLRQLSYDEMLERRDGGSKYIMEQMGGSNAGMDNKIAVEMANKWSNHYSFPRCIVEHNLLDDDDNLIDFSKPAEAFKKLNPRVGMEIERLIDNLNQEAEPGEDFTPQPGSSLQDGTAKLSDATAQS